MRQTKARLHSTLLDLLACLSNIKPLSALHGSTRCQLAHEVLILCIPAGLIPSSTSRQIAHKGLHTITCYSCGATRQQRTKLCCLVSACCSSLLHSICVKHRACYCADKPSMALVCYKVAAFRLHKCPASDWSSVQVRCWQSRVAPLGSQRACLEAALIWVPLRNMHML